jgi:serine/threonine protein kinase
MPVTDYQIYFKNIVGKGFFGIVYEARKCLKNHDDGKRKYCAKLFFDEIQSQNEMTVLRHLSKFNDLRNIVQIIDVGSVCHGATNAKRSVVIMERLLGEEVCESILKKGKFSERKAAEVMHGVISGLYDLHHKARVLHR